MSKKFPKRIHATPKYVSELVYELLDVGYKSIGDVDRAVEEAGDAVIQHEKLDPPRGEKGRKFLDVGAIRISLQSVDKKYREMHG